MFAQYLNRHTLPLCPPQAYAPFPRRQERAKWEGLPETKRQALLVWGREALDGYPMLTATQFLAFSRTGDRQVYENPYFTRRNRLIGATLAECVQNDGAFLDAVVDGIWCICEESTWVLSAHNGSDHPGCPPMNERPLPDVTNPYVDLFAAQTAATLADILYLLEDRLDGISPLIARRVRQEIDRRVITPFMTHDDFWWMGMIRKDVNNWTPWIVSNVLDVLLLLERDAYRRSAGVARGLRMLDSYLAVMPEDGGCDEGAGYFNMAGAALLDALESVYAATGGLVSFYDEPKIRNIAAFPLFAHIDGPYFLNFADCDACPQMDGERIYRFGLRTRQPALCALGAKICARHEGVRPLDTPQMNRVLLTLFAELPLEEESAVPTFSALPDLQVFCWRRGGVFAAIKGGHNGESHNHNDIGSLILYLDGKPQIVDMGNCIYTASTFGPQRYTLMQTRSRNHNVPLVDGMEQAAGRAFRACDVEADETGARMDIAAAYPKEAGLRALERTLQVRENGVSLHDRVVFDRPRPVTFVFMLREKPSLAPGNVTFGAMTMRHDAALTVQAEEMPVTDARMAKNYPGSLWRLMLTAEAAEIHEQAFTMERKEYNGELC